MSVWDQSAGVRFQRCRATPPFPPHPPVFPGRPRAPPTSPHSVRRRSRGPRRLRLRVCITSGRPTGSGGGGGGGEEGEVRKARRGRRGGAGHCGLRRTLAAPPRPAPPWCRRVAWPERGETRPVSPRGADVAAAWRRLSSRAAPGEPTPAVPGRPLRALPASELRRPAPQVAPVSLPVTSPAHIPVVLMQWLCASPGPVRGQSASQTGWWPEVSSPC